MKTKLTPYNSIFILRNVVFFMILFFIISCENKEPKFTVKGDPAITKDIKVNIEIIDDSSAAMATVFYDGAGFECDNQNALRYKIYVSYKNSFFYSTEMDNLHGKIKGKSIYEIVISKSKNEVTALYRPLKESDTVGGIVLQPLNIFFKDVSQEILEKRKFTEFYITK